MDESFLFFKEEMCMAEIHGERFSNGENCDGYSFVSPSGQAEIDIIEIRGEYPEGKFGEAWTLNERSHLMAVMVSGTGRIAVREVVNGEPFVTVTDLKVTNAIEVPAETWYAWQADAPEDLVVAATFIPPFDPELYHTMTEHELQSMAGIYKLCQEHLGPDDSTWETILEDYPYDLEGAVQEVFNALIQRPDGQAPLATLKQYGVIEAWEGEDEG